MNKATSGKKYTLPDFIEVKNYFDNVLTNGQRAELRRVRAPDELAFIPAFYRLLPPSQYANKRWRKIVFFLPYTSHDSKAEKLGMQLARSEISEMRLFQMLRSHYPNDLLYLRRILQQIQPVVNWQKFGKMLFFDWDFRADKVKRFIIEDYFIAINQKKGLIEGDKNE